MSNFHSGKFSKMGGKCPTVILANFKKWEKNVQQQSFRQIFKMGGKCLTVILANFQKEEENV